MESHFCTFYKGFAKFSRDPYMNPLTRVHDYILDKYAIIILKLSSCLRIVETASH